jgi:hypothetical protein
MDLDGESGGRYVQSHPYVDNDIHMFISFMLHYREIRVWMDGAFDMMHYGHMNAFR